MIEPREYLLAIGIYYCGLCSAQAGLSHFMMPVESVFRHKQLSASFLNAKSVAISEAEINREPVGPMLKKQYHYKKRDGRLYRFRYNYVDGQLVYSEEEVSDFIVDEAESYLKVSLHEGEHIILEQNANDSGTVIYEAELSDRHSPETEWARVIFTPSVSVKQREPDGTSTQYQKGIANRVFPTLNPETRKSSRKISRRDAGKVVKPAHTNTKKKRAKGILVTQGGKRLKKTKEKTKEELWTVSKPPAYRSSGMYQLPVLIPVYENIDDLLEKARELGIEGALGAEEMPVINGLTEEDWEGITAFDDLVKKLLLDGKMTYIQFKEWMKKKKRLRDKTNGLYSSKTDVYIDLCLQRLALKYEGKALFLNWNYFVSCQCNIYVLVQHFFQHNPDATWDHFFQDESHLMTRIIDDINQGSDENVTVIERLLRQASQGSNREFPEYLFRKYPVESK